MKGSIFFGVIVGYRGQQGEFYFIPKVFNIILCFYFIIEVNEGYLCLCISWKERQFEVVSQNLSTETSCLRRQWREIVCVLLLFNFLSSCKIPTFPDFLSSLLFLSLPPKICASFCLLRRTAFPGLLLESWCMLAFLS